MGTTTDMDRKVSTWAMALLVVPLALLDGVVLLALWRWFAVPLGAPNVGLAHAIGLGALISLATHQTILNDLDDYDRNVQLVGDAISAPLTALAIGWIALQFVA